MNKLVNEKLQCNFVSVLAIILMVTAVFGSEGTSTLRIMPVGDSITRGTYFSGNTIACPVAGGYRKPLQDSLRSAGITFEFVGDLDYWAYGVDGVVDPQFSPFHHGLAGFSNTGILNGGVVPTPAEVLAAKGVTEISVPGIVAALGSNQPDVVLLMSGANGFNADARDLLIQTICNNFSGELFVASITPQKEPRSGWELVEAYNATLPATVQSLQSQGHKIHYVDMYSALTDDDITDDGVHPTAAGLEKIADEWFDALMPVIIPGTTSLSQADIYADIAGGTIHPNGYFSPKEVIAGVGVPENNQFYNGISFFQLPTNRVETANLTFTVHLKYGYWTNANASIDVWGLGYVHTPTLTPNGKNWVLMDDSDTRSLINTAPYEIQSFKIADDLVSSNQNVEIGQTFSLDETQQANLLVFINNLYAKGASPGDYAVIRVNPDAAMTCTTGTSVRFGGTWSTIQTPDRRGKLSVTLSDASTPALSEIGAQNFSHANDGTVCLAGAYSGYDLISGTFAPTPVDGSGIAFFSLPEQLLTSASLDLTVVTFWNALTVANIDVWGLGYQSSPIMNKSWLCTNDVDSRVLLNGYPPVKIADNIVTAGQTVAANDIWQPSATQQDSLRAYINQLYERGAKPGDFAVIRFNMDSTEAGGSVTRGVRWGGSHQTSPERRAALTGCFPAESNYLLNAGFESGTGVTPLNWYIDDRGFLGERTTTSVLRGGYAFRMSVNGDQSGNDQNNLNISQDVYSSDFAGRLVTLSGYVRHDTSEPLVTGSEQKVEVRMYWLGGSANGTWVTSTLYQDLLPTDVKDLYKPIIVSGLAPSDVTGIKAMVIFRSGTVDDPSITTGAACIDDLRLTVFKESPPLGTLILLR